MRQQDSEEFFSHLLKSLRQDAKKNGQREEDQPTEIFKFGLEQRLECGDCNKVRYRVDSQDSVSVPVPATPLQPDVDGEPTKYAEVKLEDCLDLAFQPETLEYSCPSCSKSVVAQRCVIKAQGHE